MAADDVKMCAKSRKIAISCGMDIGQMKVRVTRGMIYFQGTVKRMGGDREDPEADAPFLEKMDETLKKLPGYRGAQYTFDNWRMNPKGGWKFIGKLPHDAKKKH